MRRWHRAAAGAWIALMAGAGTAGPAAAQEADGPSGLVAGIDLGLTARAGGDVRAGEGGARAGLSFGADVTSRTRTQTLALSGRAEALAFGGTSEDGIERGPLEVALAYERRAARARLTFEASLREVPLEDTLSLPVEIDPDLPFDPDLLTTASGGERRTGRLSARYVWGEGGPLRLSAFADARQTRYEDAAASFEDSRSVRAGVEATGRLAPGLSARLGAETTRARTGTGAGAGTEDRRTRRLSAGLTRTTETTEIGLTVARVEGETRLGGTRTTSDSLAAELSFERALPRGTIGATLARRADLAGTREELRLRRRIDLPGGDGLALSLGAVQGEDDTELVGALDWRRAGLRGDLTLSLGREVGASVDGELTVRSSVGARLTRALDRRTGLELGADFVRLDEEDGTVTESGLLRAALTRELTVSGWRLTGGLEGRVRDGDTDPAVFVGLTRRLEVRR